MACLPVLRSPPGLSHAQLNSRGCGSPPTSFQTQNPTSRNAAQLSKCSTFSGVQPHTRDLTHAQRNTAPDTRKANPESRNMNSKRSLARLRVDHSESDPVRAVHLSRHTWLTLTTDPMADVFNSPRMPKDVLKSLGRVRT